VALLQPDVQQDCVIDAILQLPGQLQDDVPAAAVAATGEDADPDQGVDARFGNQVAEGPGGQRLLVGLGADSPVGVVSVSSG